jgi:SAM-dependent methyltransferase
MIVKALALLGLLAACASAQYPAPARPVAPVVSPSWSDEATRDAEGEAEDIVPAYVAALRARVDSAHLGDVTVTLGDPGDPHLPPASVDVVLMVHMYHEISQPFALLEHLYPALKPKARVAIIDIDRGTASHGTPRALLECELTAVGYHETSVTPLGKAYLAVFTTSGLTPPDDLHSRLVRGGCGTPSR